MDIYSAAKQAVFPDNSTPGSNDLIRERWLCNVETHQGSRRLEAGHGVPHGNAGAGDDSDVAVPGDGVSEVRLRLSPEELEDICGRHTLYIGWGCLVSSAKQDEANGFACGDTGWMETELTAAREPVVEWFDQARRRYGLPAADGWEFAVDFERQSLVASRACAPSRVSDVHDPRRHTLTPEEPVEAMRLPDMDFQCILSLLEMQGADIDAFRSQYRNASMFNSSRNQAHALVHALGDVTLGIDAWAEEKKREICRPQSSEWSLYLHEKALVFGKDHKGRPCFRQCRKAAQAPKSKAARTATPGDAIMAETYALGTEASFQRPGGVYQIDLFVTEDCNLRCSYCYLKGKNGSHPMSAKVARDAMDFFLRMPAPTTGVTWNMIGGEPLIAMDLIEEATEYFKFRVLQLNHPWRHAYTFMLSTNGVLYDDRRVQAFLFENRHHVYPAITIDGTRRKHDMHRVFPDGRGSYDVVLRNVRTALRQFPHLGTKVTFSHGDLPYLRESIVHLWDIGIKDVPANAVFEDVWEPGDSELFELQLRELADAALDSGYWRTHRCSLFWVPKKAPPNDYNVCGAGRSAAVDWRGDIHACIRFAEHSIRGTGRSTRPIGNIYTGFNRDLMRSFNSLRVSLLSPAKCLACEMNDRCSWCQGHCYEDAASDTIFHRSTAICEMHKAQWRANQYYWEQLERRHGMRPPRETVNAQPCLI
jgi:uncharacterized protein